MEGQVVVAQAFNTSTGQAKAGWISEFEAKVVYRVSSRIARVTQRNLIENKHTDEQPPKSSIWMWEEPGALW